MARIRTIKPEFWQDEKLGPMSPTDRLVFLGLVSLADDCGRLLDNVKWIDAQIFPYTDDTARESMTRLEHLQRIARGQTKSGQRVIQIVNWHHQKIERPNLGGALPAIMGHEDEREAYFVRKRVPKWLREAVFDRDGKCCQRCGRENLRLNKKDRYDSGADLGEVDHKVEAIDGGEPTIENLTLLCLPCNRKKAGEERRARNADRLTNDRRRVDDVSLIEQRQISDVSTPRPTTYDLRPTTNDQRPSLAGTADAAPEEDQLLAVAPPPTKTRPAAKPAKPPKWPDWPKEARDAAYNHWLSNFGTIDYARFIAAAGPALGHGLPNYDRPTVWDAWQQCVGIASIASSQSRFLRDPAKIGAHIAEACRILTTERSVAEQSRRLQLLLHGKEIA